mgnify:CR=1 FL=1
MAMTQHEFQKIYEQKYREISSALPDPAEIEESYYDYLEAVRINGSDGEVIFEKGENGEITWHFAPVKRPLSPFASPS